MLSVAVHKDVGEYQPKIIGKLTTRTLVCIVGGLGVAVASACYIFFVLGLSVSDNSWMIYIVSAPFWFAGFWRPKGMKFEEFLAVWLRHQLSENQLHYTSAVVPTINKEGKKKNYGKQYRKFIRTKGIEAYSPRKGYVSGSHEGSDHRPA